MHLYHVIAPGLVATFNGSDLGIGEVTENEVETAHRIVSGMLSCLNGTCPVPVHVCR